MARRDLEGLKVIDGKVEVGVVMQLLTYPSCDILEVKREGQGDLTRPRSCRMPSARWTSRPERRRQPRVHRRK